MVTRIEVDGKCPGCCAWNLAATRPWRFQRNTSPLSRSTCHRRSARSRSCAPRGTAASVSLQNARGCGEHGGGEKPAEDHEARRGHLAESARGLPYLPLLQRTRRQQQIEGVTHRVTEREVPLPAGYSVRCGAVPEQQDAQHEQPDQPRESAQGRVAVPDHAVLDQVPDLEVPA